MELLQGGDRLGEGQYRRLGAGTGSGGLCSPVERRARGEEERHCSLSSAMGKAGGEGVAAAPRPLRTPTRRIGGGSPRIEAPTLLLCALGLALSRGTEVAALLSPSIVEEEEIGGEPRIAWELGGGVVCRWGGDQWGKETRRSRETTEGTDLLVKGTSEPTPRIRLTHATPGPQPKEPPI